MLKWTRRIFLGFITLIVAILIIGLTYEQFSRWSAARNYPPPGELIEFDGASSHIFCQGKGSPTVLLEAGGSGGSVDWVSVQSTIAAMTRVCSYDRAGHLWSDYREGIMDANRIAAELSTLLESAQEPGPYIMVGHSMGGLFAIVFSQRRKSDVVGLVLVDPTTPNSLEYLPETFPPSPMPAAMIAAMKFYAATGIVRLVSGSGFEGAPLQVQEAASLYPQSRGILEVSKALGQSSQQAGEVENLGDLPLIILSGTEHEQPGMSSAVADRVKNIPLLHAELINLSSNAEHRIVEGSGHYIHWDQPEAVIEAIRDVLAAQAEQ